MESKRQQKVSRLLQKDLGEIFQKDTKSMFPGMFITVTFVNVSPDLSSAKIYLSFLMANDKQAALQQVNDQKSQVRNLLGRKIKNQVRVIPELHFYVDDNSDYASRMDDILSRLEIPPEDQESDEKK